MRIAHLKQCTSLGSSLLYRCLDEFVDELVDNESECEEHTLQLSAEDKVSDEAAKADEDWD